MRHSFIDEQISFDVSLLSPLIERIKAPCAVGEIPNSKKDALADIFPDMRSRLGMKISRLDSCVSCGKCDSECPTGAIRNGRIGSSCIRCLRCVHICPEHALEAKPRFVLKKYLDKNLGRSNEPIIYL
jgi:ferredoxin